MPRWEDRGRPDTQQLPMLLVSVYLPSRHAAKWAEMSRRHAANVPHHLPAALHTLYTSQHDVRDARMAVQNGQPPKPSSRGRCLALTLV